MYILLRISLLNYISSPLPPNLLVGEGLCNHILSKLSPSNKSDPWGNTNKTEGISINTLQEYFIYKYKDIIYQ